MLTSSPSVINSGDIQATKLLSFHDAFSEQLREAVPRKKFRDYLLVRYKSNLIVIFLIGLDPKLF